ncbi:MAG: hypothetical protein GEU79_03330 [Acidimicrobiia bacterium]|nr:hypothetical protein [Acidimicrobiia bacterium]
MKNKIGLVVVAVVASVLITAPLSVWASHRFNDVGDDNVFHDDIDWLADNGITLGCNPPENTEFCPEEPVTRQEMAAFLHRMASQGGAVFGTRDTDLATSGTTTDGRADLVESLDFVAPSDGVIHVTAKALLTNQTDTPAETNAALMLDGKGDLNANDRIIDGSRYSLDGSGEPGQSVTTNLSTAVPVSAGKHTVDMYIDGAAGATSWTLENISVVFTPNGSATKPGVTPEFAPN